MKRQLLILLAVLLVVFAIIAYRYYHFQQEKDHLVLYGNVDIRQVDLGFRISGRVTEMLFEEGDLIAPGVLLGRLDITPYDDQLRQAEAAVLSNKLSLKNAETLLQRRQELVGDGSVSQEDLDNALTSRDIAAANLKQSEAALGVALTNLKDTEVFSPSKGTILTRIREPGTVVKASDPIYTLSIAHPVWIRAYVSEPELGLIYPGMEGEIHTDTPEGKIYKGKVGFISPVAEFTPKTVETTQLRTDLVYRLRLYADNPDHGLRQGMPVTITLPLDKSEGQKKRE
jgi:HlyD family secretion protein